MGRAAAEIGGQIGVGGERLRIFLVALLVDRQVAGLAAIHLADTDEVHVVDDVRQQNLLDLERRRHEVEQRRIAEIVFHHAGRDNSQALAQAILFGVDLVDRLLHGDDFAGVLSELFLDVRDVRLRLLACQVELAELALLVLGDRFLLREVEAVGTRRLEVVAILIVGRLHRLEGGGGAEQRIVRVFQLGLQFVDLGLVGGNLLLRRGLLRLQRGQLGSVDAAPRLLQVQLRDLRLEPRELALRLLPVAVEVVPHHPDDGKEQEQAGRREHDVQEVDVIGVPDALFVSHGLDVEEKFRNRHDVFQVEDPAREHLDRQRHHHEEEHDADVVARRPQLLVVGLEPHLGEQDRQGEDAEQHEEDPDDLAQEPVARVGGLEHPDPEIFRQVDVGQRRQLVDVPEFEGPEEVPVRSAQEGAEDDQRAPEHDKAKQEDGDLGLALVEGEVAVALRVLVDVRDADQPDDDQSWQDDAGQPGIEIDEHFLQAQEVPRRLGWIRRIRGIGRLLERRLQENRPDDQHDRAEDQRDQLGVDQVRPDPDAVGLFLLDRPLPRRDAPVVQHRLADGIPDEEGQQEDQSDDRDIVRLRDDEPEVRIERAENEERREQAEQRETNGVGGDRIALPDHDDESEHREHEEQPRVGNGVDSTLDKAHS